ncbi:hypothetical protein [Streptomyces sp. Isolate_219]|uniref:hypothetical protein n=1 Tax=Streptomyces sp. Isolate_219 TaxID=2950110 RepID=UPI0021C9C43B|nr:hypothetical protein [Streptomyces sp. Isolate_219]MCR8573067.1 hypothetical protein [Streptomyces sp. Isolate_219]
MQFLRTPAGDEVAVMQAQEVLVLEVALSRYVLERPNSNLAVRMLADASRVNEEREARMENAAQVDPG